MSRILEPTSPEMSRPRGRPRSFDEREALQKAIRVFWAKGYDAVTGGALVAGMGVARPSLYAVFGDKAALFMRSLRAYAEGLGGGAMKALLVRAVNSFTLMLTLGTVMARDKEDFWRRIF